ncbi:hypothetical protein Msi02_17960 [Microbispora siamensis]|uniref:Uncharacterized protein n=1 Tax=Microbispora siamensis TaxID=564413 RepID=A0ABQ4GHQ4_9ACTN|nr:hypothetical protein Msi02_17960 [Microbispora siamensis]
MSGVAAGVGAASVAPALTAAGAAAAGAAVVAAASASAALMRGIVLLRIDLGAIGTRKLLRGRGIRRPGAGPSAVRRGGGRPRDLTLKSTARSRYPAGPRPAGCGEPHRI